MFRYTSICLGQLQATAMPAWLIPIKISRLNHLSRLAQGLLTAGKGMKIPSLEARAHRR